MPSSPLALREGWGESFLRGIQKEPPPLALSRRTRKGMVSWATDSVTDLSKLQLDRFDEPRRAARNLPVLKGSLHAGPTPPAAALLSSLNDSARALRLPFDRLLSPLRK